MSDLALEVPVILDDPALWICFQRTGVPLSPDLAVISHLPDKHDNPVAVAVGVQRNVVPPERKMNQAGGCILL